MAYTKQTWQTGEVITADKLNYMEDGIAESPNITVVHFIIDYEQSPVAVTADKTFSELKTAIENGVVILGVDADGQTYTTSVIYTNNMFDCISFYMVNCELSDNEIIAGLSYQYIIMSNDNHITYNFLKKYF